MAVIPTRPGDRPAGSAWGNRKEEAPDNAASDFAALFGAAWMQSKPLTDAGFNAGRSDGVREAGAQSRGVTDARTRETGPGLSETRMAERAARAPEANAAERDSENPAETARADLQPQTRETEKPVKNMDNRERRPLASARRTEEVAQQSSANADGKTDSQTASASDRNAVDPARTGRTAAKATANARNRTDGTDSRLNPAAAQMNDPRAAALSSSRMRGAPGAADRSVSTQPAQSAEAQTSANAKNLTDPALVKDPATAIASIDGTGAASATAPQLQLNDVTDSIAGSDAAPSRFKGTAVAQAQLSDLSTGQGGRTSAQAVAATADILSATQTAISASPDMAAGLPQASQAFFEAMAGSGVPADADANISAGADVTANVAQTKLPGQSAQVANAATNTATTLDPSAIQFREKTADAAIADKRPASALPLVNARDAAASVATSGASEKNAGLSTSAQSQTSALSIDTTNKTDNSQTVTNNAANPTGRTGPQDMAATQKPGTERTASMPSAVSAASALSGNTGSNAGGLSTNALNSTGSDVNNRETNRTASSMPNAAVTANAFNGVAAFQSVAARDDAPRLVMSTPITEPGFAEELHDTVQLVSTRGLQSVEISITPAELGPIRMKVELDGKQASVSFEAAQEQTRTLLAEAVPALKEQLSQSGIDLRHATVDRQGSFAGGNPSQGQLNQGGGQQDSQGRSNQGNGNGAGSDGQRSADVPAATAPERRMRSAILDTYA